MPSSAYSDIAAGDAMVRTIIERPTRDGAVGAVLVAWGFEGIDTPGTDELRTDFSAELERANLACVTIEARRGGRNEPASACVAAIVDEASAVLRWMLVQDDLDPARIGVCGVGAGAITAAALAGRTDQVRAVCLLAPWSPSGLETANRGGGEDNGTPRVSAEVLAAIGDLTPVESLARHDRPTLVLTPSRAHRDVRESARAYAVAVERAGHAVHPETVARADADLGTASIRSAATTRVASFFAEMPAGVRLPRPVLT